MVKAASNAPTAIAVSTVQGGQEMEEAEDDDLAPAFKRFWEVNITFEFPSTIQGHVDYCAALFCLSHF
jgi:hypothetical protein